MTDYERPSDIVLQAPPMATRQDSMRTVDMRIPGAWNGTNPSTPAPIGEDVNYFGEKLKTVPGTVQGYMPARDDIKATGSTMLDKAVAMVPANVMNTVTNVLPKSVQPTMSPTAADAVPPAHPTDSTSTGAPPVVTTTNTIGHHDVNATPKEEAPVGGNSFLNRAAAMLPAGVVGAAAAYLPESMKSKPEHTTDKSLSPNDQGVTSLTPAATKSTEETPAGTTWTEKAASILPASAAAYLPGTSQDVSQQGAPTPVGERAGLNAPLPSIPLPSHGPVVGSTVSPDADVQEALGNAANPHKFKSAVVQPMEPKSAAAPPLTTQQSTAPSLPPKDDQSIVDSTRAIGGRTPVTPGSFGEGEADGYPEKHKTGVSGIGALAAGGVGALATDHALKDHHDATFDSQKKGKEVSGLGTLVDGDVGAPTTNYPSKDQHTTGLNPEKDEKGFSSIGALAAGGAGALATDHALKDQHDAAVDSQKRDKGVSNLGPSVDGDVGVRTTDYTLKDQHDTAIKYNVKPIDAYKPQDSFMHVVVPATPGAGLHEQENFDKKQAKRASEGAALATPEKLRKKDRSGSISAGEASPSSPSKNGGVFGSIRKLTKKKDRSGSKSHEKDFSGEDYPAGAAPPTHADSLDTQDSNPSDPNSASGNSDKRDKHVLHKDPPVGYGAAASSQDHQEGPSPTSAADNASHTPGMLANPFSPSSPSASSPSKVGFREKVKGEFMVVQGSLTRDKGLKEAGEKLKKGTL